MSAWIPLMDYAIKKGVSISTLRRYIKSNKIKYRTEAGKYLLWDDDAGAQFLTGAAEGKAERVSADRAYAGERTLQSSLFMPSFTAASTIPSVEEDRIHQLEGKLQKAQAEIAELKMLVSLYEDQLHLPKSF